jgi:hypothetical protein
MTEFVKELEHLINKYSMERKGGDTPDFILANYLKSCLIAFDEAVRSRSDWYQNTSEKTISSIEEAPSV